MATVDPLLHPFPVLTPAIDPTPPAVPPEPPGPAAPWFPPGYVNLSNPPPPALPDGGPAPQPTPTLPVAS
jgi:hypothetical protein